jgi:transposase
MYRCKRAWLSLADPARPKQTGGACRPTSEPRQAPPWYRAPLGPDRARNLVERFFNKVKQCRRVATRYDKLAANYLAFIQLASIRLWLRFNESAP